MTKKEKTYLEEMDRGVYDIKNKFTYKSKTEKGLTEDIVRQISKEKEEAAWMLESRLKALKIFNEKDMIQKLYITMFKNIFQIKE